MPLLHHAVLRLVEVTHDVVVVLPPTPNLPRCRRRARPLVHDAAQGQGPLEGALSGPRASGPSRGAGGDSPSSTAVSRCCGWPPLRGPTPWPCRTANGSAVAAGGCAEPAREVAHALRHAGEHRLLAAAGLRTAVIDEATWQPSTRTWVAPGHRRACRYRAPRHRLAAMSHEPFRAGDVEIAVLPGWSLPLADESTGHDVDWAESGNRSRGRSTVTPTGSGTSKRSSSARRVGSHGGHGPRRAVLSPVGAGEGLTAEGVRGCGPRTLGGLHGRADPYAPRSFAGSEERRRAALPNARHVLHPADWAFLAEDSSPRSPRRDGRAFTACTNWDAGLDEDDREVRPGSRSGTRPVTRRAIAAC
jgi:hypothetical protein